MSFFVIPFIGIIRLLKIHTLVWEGYFYLKEIEDLGKEK
jgi:hypothetical protein